MTDARRVLKSGLTRLAQIPYAELVLTGQVVTADLADSAITNAKISASADIDPSKIVAGIDGQLLGQSGGTPQWVDVDELPATPATARFAGEVTWHAGATAPSGWLVADGSSYLRADYDDLFTAIGVLHGSADGTHFNVPNLVGKSPRGALANGSNVGGTGGSDSVTLVTGNLPTHTHSFSATTGATSGGTPAGTISIAGSGTLTSGTESADHTHAYSGTTGTENQAHNHTPTLASQFAMGNGTTASLGSGGTSRYIVGSFESNTYTESAAHNHNYSGSTGGRSAAHTHDISSHGHAGSTFTGSALSTHTHSVSGTTGSAGSDTAVDITPAHVKLLPVIKT